MGATQIVIAYRLILWAPKHPHAPHFQTLHTNPIFFEVTGQEFKSEAVIMAAFFVC